MIAVPQGMILIGADQWDIGAVYAQVHAPGPQLAEHVYRLLESNTGWPIQLVDTTDAYADDIVIHHRGTATAARASN